MRSFKRLTVFALFCVGLVFYLLAFNPGWRASAQVSQQGVNALSAWAASTVVTSTQASATRAAGGAAVHHVLNCLTFSATAATAPTLTDLTVLVRDGASGTGTILYRFVVDATAGTGNLVPPFGLCGMQLLGSGGTAMTIEFSSGVTNLRETVSMSGYDITQ